MKEVKQNIGPELNKIVDLNKRSKRIKIEKQSPTIIYLFNNLMGRKFEVSPERCTKGVLDGFWSYI